MCSFIDEHKHTFGARRSAACSPSTAGEIAPRTSDAHRARPQAARALWDMTITEVLTGIYDLTPGT